MFSCLIPDPTDIPYNFNGYTFENVCWLAYTKRQVHKMHVFKMFITAAAINPEGGGDSPLLTLIGMCGAKGYGFSAVLVINRVSIWADFLHLKVSNLKVSFNLLSVSTDSSPLKFFSRNVFRFSKFLHEITHTKDNVARVSLRTARLGTDMDAVGYTDNKRTDLTWGKLGRARACCTALVTQCQRYRPGSLSLFSRTVNQQGLTQIWSEIWNSLVFFIVD